MQRDIIMLPVAALFLGCVTSAAQNVRGRFDKHAVEDIPLDGRQRPERVPHRIDELFGGSSTTLHFAMPDERHTNYVVCFDTLEFGRGKPRRYHGLVGDGNKFVESFGHREIAATHFDCFVDFDIDGDGDRDFFPSFGDGPGSGQIIFYRNVTREREGQPTFTRVGPLQSTTRVPLAGGPQAGGWFPSIAFTRDWIEDNLNDRRPLVAIGRLETRPPSTTRHAKELTP